MNKHEDMSAQYNSLSEKFDMVLGEGLYVEKISSVYGETLHNDLRAFIKEISEHMRIINKCRELISNDDFAGFNVANDELTQHFSNLIGRLDKLLETLVGIKVDRLDI